MAVLLLRCVGITNAIMKNAYTTIDEYIAGFPDDTREILESMRAVIREAAPEATEAIAYGIPTFRQNGNLVHFAAFKDHTSFFPTPSGIERFRKELAPYPSGKGTVRFPSGTPVPYDLIAKIVRFRVEENRNPAERNEEKKRKKSAR